MIVGGTGITPMLQALHALLGTPGDDTEISLVVSNRAQKDILAREALASWEVEHSGRLRITHTLTREPEGSGWQGRRGRIDRALLQELIPPPSEDVAVFVCGPAGMYTYVSGPRGEEGLQGVLADMGYAPSQVVKF
jgi:cytochrome-b5 reductase